MASKKSDTREIYEYICKLRGVKPKKISEADLLNELKKSVREQNSFCDQKQTEFEKINERITDFLEVIRCLASLDYSKKAYVTGEGDLVDALAVGINMMGEELQQSTVSLSEKEVLLKEIHHRVKNNLQLVCSLLNIQSSYISDPESLVKFRESQDRVNSMALIHERLYISKNFSRINFGNYLDSIANYLSAVYNISPERITVKVDILPDTGMLSLDTALPCGLIVNELLSNSFKYAFPGDRKGKILFSLTREQGKKKMKYTLLIEDNGVGLPKKLDIRKTESLGMQLVTTLVEQIDGKLEILKGPGAKFKITFDAE